jgi:hypothetical protein
MYSALIDRCIVMPASGARIPKIFHRAISAELTSSDSIAAQRQQQARTVDQA